MGSGMTDNTSTSTSALAERYTTACKDASRHPDPRERSIARTVARGLHAVMRERGLAGDGDVAIGGPHWLTYNEGSMT